MALIKRCPCGCINESSEAVCRKCGDDILFMTTEDIPDDQYEMMIASQNGTSVPSGKTPAVPPVAGDAFSQLSSENMNTTGDGEVFDLFNQKPAGPRRGEGVIIKKTGSSSDSSAAPMLFKFCKCGEVNSQNSPVCSRCGKSLAAVAAMTKQKHDQMVMDLKQVQPAENVCVSGKYLCSLDNMCVLQPKPNGEKSIIGRSSSDKAVRDYLESRKGVSRNHANLWHDGNNLFIEDIGSTNGTYIDNRRIDNNRSYVLKPGNQVSFGNPRSETGKIAVFKVI